jgi:chromosome segregation ATPase
LYFILDTRNRLAAQGAAQQASIEKLDQRQGNLEAQIKASNEVWAQRLGITVQQLQTQLQRNNQSHAAALQRQQASFDERLQAQKEQIGQVTGDVANVRGELSGAKKDIVDTRTDLESTKARLERAVGDLTGQGSLIARTREDLEELRHRGDRDYFEFTLSKGAPTQVSTIRLQLKKADAKKHKFTLIVTADDRIVEKKDRGVAEPLQFYSGKDRQLYEVVIFSVEKNKVTGYLSTPKSPSSVALVR